MASCTLRGSRLTVPNEPSRRGSSTDGNWPSIGVSRPWRKLASARSMAEAESKLATALDGFIRSCACPGPSSPAKHRQPSRRRLGRLHVIVDVGFPSVLLGLVLVGLVCMGDGRVVVFVIVRGRQMGPLLTLCQIVGHMGVLMLMDLGLMAVL